MTLMSAAALASLLSFVVFALFAVWYIAPWLAARQRAEALIPLLWIHAFRHIALQIFAAQKFGFAVSDAARDQIAAGDVTGMILALIAILALHYRARIASILVFRRRNGFRPCERNDSRRSRAAVRDGIRRHLADPDILCPAALGEPRPHRLATLCTTPGAASLGPRMSRSPSLRIDRRSMAKCRGCIRSDKLKHG
jgi:hypothetical protein